VERSQNHHAIMKISFLATNFYLPSAESDTFPHADCSWRREAVSYRVRKRHFPHVLGTIFFLWSCRKLQWEH